MRCPPTPTLKGLDDLCVWSSSNDQICLRASFQGTWIRRISMVLLLIEKIYIRLCSLSLILIDYEIWSLFLPHLIFTTPLCSALTCAATIFDFILSSSVQILFIGVVVQRCCGSLHQSKSTFMRYLLLSTYSLSCADYLVSKREPLILKPTKI